jgi:hypothetical protein
MIPQSTGANEMRAWLMASVILLLASRAEAGLIILSGPSDLATSDTMTAPYSGGEGFHFTPYTAIDGDTTLTFTDLSNVLYRQDVSPTILYDYAIGTHLLLTIDESGNPAGPLTIAFGTPVVEFGLFAQSNNFDTETLSFTAYDGTKALGSYTSPHTDNTGTPGVALFLGARSTGGDVITSVVISSVSSDPAFTNDFVVGPVTLSAVPEPSTFSLLGIAALALVGVARRYVRVS